MSTEGQEDSTPSPSAPPYPPYYDQEPPDYSEITSINSPPPTYAEAIGSSCSEQLRDIHTPPITPSRVRVILQQNFAHSSKKMKVMDKIELIKLENPPVFWYQMQFLTEERKMTRKSGVYRVGEEVDDIRKGPVPNIYEVQVEPTVPTTQSPRASKNIYLQHSEEVVNCGSCKGHKNLECGMCKGRGVIGCYFCNWQDHQPCQHCNKTRLISCSSCNSKGRIKCEGCKGNGLIKTWKALNIQWQIQFVNHRCYPLDLEWKNISDTRRWNLIKTKDQEVGSSSGRIIPLTCEKYPQTLIAANIALEYLRDVERRNILKIQQTIWDTQVVKVRFKYGDMDNCYFYIYGNYQQIFFPEKYQFWKLKPRLVSKMKSMFVRG